MRTMTRTPSPAAGSPTRHAPARATDRVPATPPAAATLPLRSLGLLLVVVLVAALAGCATRDIDRGSPLTLMERFDEGKDLMHDGEGAAKTKGTAETEAAAHLQRGIAYMAQDRQELAFEHFSRAAALDPRMLEARFMRAQMLVRRGMSQEAAADIQAVLTLDQHHARAWELAGIVAFDKALFDEAEADFTRALSLDPDLARSYAYLGAVHNYRGHPERAREVYAVALERFPRSGEMHNNLGVACSMMGDDAAAVQHFHEAVTLGAASPRAWNNMGLALCRLGRFDEAFEAFRNAGGEAAAHNNLGYFFLVNGDPALAVNHLQRAVELEPRYYARAAENLKRARLAARFAASGTPLPSAGPDRGEASSTAGLTGSTVVRPPAKPAASPAAVSGATGRSARPAIVQERDIRDAAAPGVIR